MTESPPPAEGRQTRPFADVFNSLRRGRTGREASTTLQELVNAVRDTGRQGTITIKLKVSRNKAGMLEIDDTITSSPPKPERDSSLFYADTDGNLSKDNPYQEELPGVRSVTSSAPAERAAQ